VLTGPFVVESREIEYHDGCEARFRYRLGDETFEERVTFGPLRDVDQDCVLAALELAHLVLGVSYYKLALPQTIEVRTGPITAAAAAMMRAVYDDGLRELRATNGLPPRNDVTVEAERRPAQVTPRSGATRPLVPVGGGKDSATVLAMLDDATALVVNPTPAHMRLVDAFTAECHRVQRTLDPRLFELTKAGGYNGHVPITAINSSLAVLDAALTGFTDVVMANERSADAPTRLVDGVPVNHQYSKSFAFEQLFAAAAVETGVRYFSLLRQLSDVAIAGRLAPSPLRNVILSCNTGNFGVARTEGSQGWCCNCDKCRFTFLCFACFLEPAELVEMFGTDMLAHEQQTRGFTLLLRDDEKPYDCVGETGEAAAAIVELASKPSWKDHAVVRALIGEAAAIASPDDFASYLAPTGPSLVPDAYRERSSVALPAT
jgi:hypothetical protein